MSTTSVQPLRLDDAFRLAARAGFDGIEVMITRDRDTQSAAAIRASSERHGLPVISVHAPVLLFSSHVFGRDPRGKLERSVALAAELDAQTVVVHPPFRWQKRFTVEFEATIRRLSSESGLALAVENMFPLQVRGRTRNAFAPHWNPGEFDVDAMTLDFSHAAMSGVPATDFVTQWGSRLRHVHLCDGGVGRDEGFGAATDRPYDPATAPLPLFDEHLVPGRGSQPVAEVLRSLAAGGFEGGVIAEINSRACGRDDALRLEWLRETLDFAREHLARPLSRADLRLAGRGARS